MEPLTTEEAEFAAKHHDLIIHFLSSRHLSEVDFYDVAAMGFIKAVKNWFVRPDLHKYAFSTIAWHTMSCRVWNSQRTRKRHPTVSLDNLLFGERNLTFADKIPDPAIQVDDLICIRETITEYFSPRGGQRHENPKRLGI